MVQRLVMHLYNIYEFGTAVLQMQKQDLNMQQSNVWFLPGAATCTHKYQLTLTLLVNPQKS